MKSPLKVEVNSYIKGGKRNLKKNYGLSKEQIDKLIRRGLDRSCRVIQAYARKNHEYLDNPARLKREGNEFGLTRAIRFHLIDKAKRGEIYIDKSRAPVKDGTYAKYQIEGTEEHGAHSGRLRFFLDHDRRGFYLGGRKMQTYKGSEGLWISTKKVRGIKKDDFLNRAYSNTRSRVMAIFDEELRRIING